MSSQDNMMCFQTKLFLFLTLIFAILHFQHNAVKKALKIKNERIPNPYGRCEDYVIASIFGGMAARNSGLHLPIASMASLRVSGKDYFTMLQFP